MRTSAQKDRVVRGCLSAVNRELTQQGGSKIQVGRMTKRLSRKIRNAQSRATFFRHSAVLSRPALLLRKLPNVIREL